MPEPSCTARQVQPLSGLPPHACPQRLNPILDTETGKPFKPIDATPQRLKRTANDNHVTQEGARRLTDYSLVRLEARGVLHTKFRRRTVRYAAVPVISMDYSRDGEGGTKTLSISGPLPVWGQ